MTESKILSPKILLIDDEEIIRERLSKLLILDGYEVTTAEDGPRGLEAFDKFLPDVVVSDIKMPQMDGIEVLRIIKERVPNAGVILLSGHGDLASTIKALRIGAFDYLAKPVEYDELAISINRLLDLQSNERERKQLQTQLFQSAKLASVGTLAAGIAHELNNPLAVVVAYANELLEMIKEPPFDANKANDMARFLDMIVKSSSRMQEIVKNMLSYSRQSGESSDQQRVNLNDVINLSFKFVQRRFEKLNVTQTFELSAEPLFITGDVGQLQSVFVNLMSNSCDAFDAFVTAQGETQGKDRALAVGLSSVLDANGQIIIVYKDNAGGMSPEVVQRIFDPFFTTKEVGKGTGLGMSVTLGIVENHKGKITVESEVGQGSTFTIKFPFASTK